jgi:hypothetical protein
MNPDWKDDAPKSAGPQARYTYKMLQIPKGVLLESSRGQATAAADYMETTVNEMAGKGWEFQRVDTMNIVVNPGCFGVLVGERASNQAEYVLTFRRQV